VVVNFFDENHKIILTDILVIGFEAKGTHFREEPGNYPNYEKTVERYGILIGISLSQALQANLNSAF